MNNKFVALFLTLLMSISMVSLVFADDSADENGSQVPTLTSSEPDLETAQDRPKDVRALSAKRTRAMVDKPEAEPALMKEAPEPRKLMEKKVERPAFVKREVAQKVVMRAREAYQNARQKYFAAKNKYDELRPKFLEAKKAFQECADDETFECTKVKATLAVKAQPYLVKTADVVLSSIEKARAKVEESDSLSEDEIAEILAELDEEYTGVSDAKAVIEGLTEDSTSDDVKEASETIRAAWQKTKRHLKWVSARMFDAQLGNVLHRADVLTEKLESIKSRLEERGADVAPLEDIIDNYDTLTADAIEEYDLAKADFALAKESFDEELVRSAHEHLKLANEKIRDARHLLRDAVNEIKKLNAGSLNVADDSDEQGVNETDDVDSNDSSDDNSDEVDADSDDFIVNETDDAGDEE